MKVELGIAKCGLACCVCSKNNICKGCNSECCTDKEWCENRKCSKVKKLRGCYECGESCSKMMLTKLKPAAFTSFIKSYGYDELMTCLARNEKYGVVYHREGIIGDYDNFNNIEDIINFIKMGK